MLVRDNHIIASFWHRYRNLVIASSLGTIIFILITGGKILNPSDHDWLIIGDSAQHYFGGASFRHTPLLQWPLGKNHPYGMELSSSIVFTDSIPIAAFLLKLFSFLLPASFQYFGIWIWGCFVLQAQFGQLLLRYFIRTTSHIWLGTCFLLISPPLTYRLIHQGYGHIALASHWLILASIWLYFRAGRNDARWVLLISGCWLIQAYFIPMVVAVWFATLIKRIMIDKNFFKIAVSVMSVGLSSIIVMWSSGYFVIGSNFNPVGWNYVFRWQPLSLVDSGTAFSSDWSHLLPDLGQLAGDTEGFSFLGLGLIVLSLICTFKLCHTRKFLSVLTLSIVLLQLFLPFKATIALVALAGIICFVSSFIQLRYMQQQLSYIIPLFIAVIALAFYSMTNRVGFGQHTLFQYPLFTPLQQFTETFRTHGRSIWPAYYLLVIGLIIATSRSFSRRTASMLFALLLTIQFIDSLPAFSSARNRFTTITHWSSPFTDARWNSLTLDRVNIIVVPPLNNDEAGLWMAVNDLAITHGMNTNSGYFSRYNETLYASMTSKYIQDVQTNNLDSNTIYIINDDAFWNSLVAPSFGDHFRGTLNGFNVIAP